VAGECWVFTNHKYLNGCRILQGRALHRTLLGKLTALHRFSSWLGGDTFFLFPTRLTPSASRSRSFHLKRALEVECQRCRGGLRSGEGAVLPPQKIFVFLISKWRVFMHPGDIYWHCNCSNDMFWTHIFFSKKSALIKKGWHPGHPLPWIRHWVGSFNVAHWRGKIMQSSILCSYITTCYITK